jgi:hypothetical protein
MTLSAAAEFAAVAPAELAAHPASTTITTAAVAPVRQLRP